MRIAMPLKRAIHRWTAYLAARWPQLSDHLVASFEPVTSTDVPWQPIDKPLRQATIALVTTAGIHHRDQTPFDMLDPLGDPSFRAIDPKIIAGDYRITHDYYDHRDADRDLNIVFPITRLHEMLARHCVGAIADEHFSFMGHIDGRHVNTLTDRTAPRVAQRLKDMKVDVVLLTPA
jgi:D-proline reductase (dithiol) PrdB